MLNKTCKALACLALCLQTLVVSGQSLYTLVNPLIGSEGKGNVFIGPSCPFGMVKPGPDNNKDFNSGYDMDPSRALYGFSQLHVSGTGGGPKYGNISIMPFKGDFLQKDQTSLRSDEVVETGYYGVTLTKSKIRVELTTTNRVAFYRLHFDGKGKNGITIDLGKFLGEEAVPDAREAQQFVGSEVEIVSATEVKGYSRIRGGWNNGAAYTVYFHLMLDKPCSSFGTWKGNEFLTGVKSQFDSGEKTGACLLFDKVGQVQMKVGISFVSEQKAKQNMLVETPDWNFDVVLNQVRNAWENYLTRIQLAESTPVKQKKMFYTALYHTLLMPVDRNGENPLWTATPYYDDFYAIWDTYRTSSPLLTLIAPERQTDIVNALLNIYRYDGYLPDARSGNCNGRTQGGSNAEVVIADAYVKGLKGIDYEMALNAMLKDATVPPGGNEEKEGRGGLVDYLRLGYVSHDYVRAGNRTLEYAFDDYCLAQVAKGLGKEEVYQRFHKQSDNWKNLWREVSDNGFQGFIMPRASTGEWLDSVPCSGKNGNQSFLPYKPLSQDWPTCVCWWCGFFYEGNSWEYSFFVPHDVGALVQKCGGPEQFGKRLDAFFANGYYNVSNEPSFLTPCLYHWIGRPDLSEKRVRSIVETHFNDSNNGIPGNDDSGAMSSWLAFHMLGLYPNAGHSYYLLHAPMVEESTLMLDGSKTLRIKAEPFSPQYPYVQSIRLNGKTYDKSWIDHRDLVNGGELLFEMGSKPSSWGSEGIPPSKSVD